MDLGRDLCHFRHGLWFCGLCFEGSLVGSAQSADAVIVYQVGLKQAVAEADDSLGVRAMSFSCVTMMMVLPLVVQPLEHGR